MCFCVIYIVLFFEGFVLLVLILYTQVATQSKTVGLKLIKFSISRLQSREFCSRGVLFAGNYMSTTLNLKTVNFRSCNILYVASCRMNEHLRLLDFNTPARVLNSPLNNRNYNYILTPCGLGVIIN